VAEIVFVPGGSDKRKLRDTIRGDQEEATADYADVADEEGGKELLVIGYWLSRKGRRGFNNE
jgi:hypothetical protein